MSPDSRIFRSLILKVLVKIFKKNFKHIHLIGLAIIALSMLTQCESEDRFYRPNLPEKLSCIGIIDADDTTRYISFEKSYQSEYPEEVNDSLRNLNFSLLSGNEELFSYQFDHAIKNLYGFKIPDNIEFHSGAKYSLFASETSTDPISSEITVPEIPSIPLLNSLTRVSIASSNQIEPIKRAVINISFEDNNEQEMYYAILVKGWGTGHSSLGIPEWGLWDFSVNEGNTPGFLEKLYNYTTYHYTYEGTSFKVKRTPISAYFINGSEIPDKVCNITLSVQFSDSYCIYNFLKSVRIRLLSIPKELYLFEKSLYTYNQNKEDPFSEPVYLYRNIKGGYGIFAVCRSTELPIEFSTWF